MSAFADDPDHFHRWLVTTVGRQCYPESVSVNDFVPRHLYGDYITEVLARARATVAPGVIFELVPGE